MITLYASKSISPDLAKHTRFFTDPIGLGTLEEFRQFVAHRHHSPHLFKGGYRRKENWFGASCIVLDVDEGCSIEEFQKLFKGVKYYLATSRSHNKSKGEGENLKPPCDRFHVYFPLSRAYAKDEAQAYQALIREMLDKYPFFDKASSDLARMFRPSGSDVIVLEGHDE